VPRAAHHGHVREAFASRGTDAAPHHRLPLERQGARLGQRRPHRAHRLRDRVEHIAGRAPRLDEAVPEPLTVIVAGGSRELRERVGAHALRDGYGVTRDVDVARILGRCLGPLDGLAHDREVDARRKVDEPDRGPVLDRPPHRDPLRRERGLRIERRDPRLVRRIDEQRDRRPHRGIGCERDELGRVRRSLDEHGIGTDPLELREHAPGGARSVMADAEDGDHVIRRRRDRRDRGRASRHVPS
jgi:hypothetical protein